MKKFLLLAVLALGLVACGQKEEAKVEEATQVEQAVETPAAEEEVITFTREDGEANIVVKSSDKFETATIVIEDQEYAAKRVEAADGVKVATEDEKISVHFKNDYGVLEMDGTEVNLTVVKEQNNCNRRVKE